MGREWKRMGLYSDDEYLDRDEPLYVSDSGVDKVLLYSIRTNGK